MEGIFQMAKVKYSLQRLGDNSFVDTVKETLSKEHSKAFYYSAFLREDSVSEIKEFLEKESDLKAIIGIRNGATSSQGLKALLSTGVQLFVVDTGSPITIFHAKSLLVVNEKNDKAFAAIGSSNFTPGGFYRNIENNIFIELDLKDKSDKEFYDDFMSGFYSLMAYVGNGDNVLEITNNMEIDNFLNDGRVVDEESSVIKASLGRNRAGTKAIKGMKLNPYKQRGSNLRSSASKKSKSSKTTLVLTSMIQGQIEEVWKSKELKERDLTIPSNKKTNPTGSMLMKKGAYDINQQSYFYNEVFKDLSWVRKNPKQPHYQFAEAKFYFIIEGIEYGPYELTLKYDERTDTASYLQKQPNVSLSWGKAGEIIKNRNLLGKIMYLYRVVEKADEFLIEIKDD